jgi:WD40 repeat protein
MRQIGILPSGCQTQNPGAVIHINEHRIMYASTLSVVVINAKTYVIEKILATDHTHSGAKQKSEAEKQGAITSFSVSPHDANCLVTCGESGVVCCWDIKAQHIVRRVTVPNCGKVLVSWNPHDEDDVALVASAHNTIKFMSWRVSGTAVSELYQVKASDNGNNGGNVSISVIRWNPNLKGQVAIGCRNGTVVVFDTKKKKPPMPLTSSEGGKDNVVDLQWDRLSTIYILIAYEFTMSLWDVETG